MRRLRLGPSRARDVSVAIVRPRLFGSAKSSLNPGGPRAVLDIAGSRHALLDARYESQGIQKSELS